MGARKARFGLRNVGAGDLAHREPVPRFAQLLLQDLHIVALQIEQRRVPQHVHIGRDAVEQRILFARAQACSDSRTPDFAERILLIVW